MTVSWYGGDPVNTAMSKALALFGKSHSNAKISSWHDPFGNFWPKMSTQVAGGTAPDVTRMSMTYFLEYVDKGALMDLTSDIGHGIDITNLDKSVGDSGKVKGKYYGVGQSSIVQTIIYSPSRLQVVGAKVPDGSWTWSNLAELAAGYAKAAGPKKYGINDAGGDILSFEVWVRQHGTNLFTTDGKAVAFSPDTLSSWFDYWDKMRKTKAAPPASITAEASGFPQAPLSRRLAAMQTGWIQQILFYQPLNKDDLEETNLPGTSANDLKGQYVKSLDLWSVSATSKSRKDDVALINFLLNDEGAIKALGMTLGVPPSDKARKLLNTGAKTPTGKAIAYLNKVKSQVGEPPPPWAKGYSQVSNLLSMANQNVGFGKATVAKASQQFFTQAKKITAS